MNNNTGNADDKISKIISYEARTSTLTAVATNLDKTNVASSSPEKFISAQSTKTFCKSVGKQFEQAKTELYS